MRAILPCAVALFLAGCNDPPPPSPVPIAPVTSVAIVDSSSFEPPPDIVGEGTPAGAPAPFVGEPDVPPDRSSPPALVKSLERALEAKDLKALARLKVPPSSKARLDEDDLARARRDFLGPQREGYWKRVLKGLDTTKLGSEGSRVEVRSEVGGSLGQVRLVFERTDDGWVLR